VNTRGPHSVQEVPDRVRPGRQFAIISRKPFAHAAKLTPYTCPMKRAVIIPPSSRLPTLVKIGQNRHLLKFSKNHTA
ncbi:Uncharacterized protein APZ42_016220, partial [Daphnia magna]